MSSRISVAPFGVDEKRGVLFDFAAWVPAGVTISAASAVSTVYSGIDDTPDIINGSAAISGTGVTQVIGGDTKKGTLGVIYKVTMTATLSDAQIIPMGAYIAYVPDIGFGPGGGSGGSGGGNGQTLTIGGTFDGGGEEPTVGTVFYAVAQWAGTITRWDIVADQVGSAVVDVWKVNGAIPTVANTIAAAAKPTLATDQLETNIALTGWTTNVMIGDVFGFNLDSVTDCTRVTVELKIEPS